MGFADEIRKKLQHKLRLARSKIFVAKVQAKSSKENSTRQDRLSSSQSFVDNVQTNSSESASRQDKLSSSKGFVDNVQATSSKSASRQDKLSSSKAITNKIKNKATTQLSRQARIGVSKASTEKMANKVDNYQFEYPIPSFYFKVVIGGHDEEAHFQEVSGISAEREVEIIQEGGENNFVYNVPKGMKYGRLVLKRGLIVETSHLFTWCQDIMSDNTFDNAIETKNITVSLMNPENLGKDLLSWEFIEAWPCKWDISNFKSDDNSITIETVEFVYKEFKEK